MGYPLDDIIRMARTAEKHPDSVGVLSTGEHCAVALVTDRKEFLPRGYTTMLDAVDRLQGDWLDACIQANRAGWRESESAA